MAGAARPSFRASAVSVLVVLLTAAGAAAHARDECRPHPPVTIAGDEGPQSFILGHHPVTGEPIYRPGSGVTAGAGTTEDPYIIEGLCLVSPPDGAALELEGTTAPVIIRQNDITGISPLLHGTGIHLSDVTNVLAEANTIQDLGWGIHFSSSRDSRAIANTLTNNGDHPQFQYQGGGIRLWQSSDILLEGNNIAGNNLRSLLVENSDGNTVRSNAIAGNQLGVLVLRSDENVIEDNAVADNGRHGIRIASASGNVVRRNTISGVTGSDQNPGDGISGGGTNTLIEDNTITDSTGHGVHLDSASSVVVSGNTIAGNGRGGLASSDTSGGAIGANTVRANNGPGISLVRTGGVTVEDNTVTANEGSGVHIEAGSSTSGNNTIRDNTIAANHGVGVLVWGSGENVVQANDIAGNSWGVAFVASADNTVRDNVVSGNDVDGVHMAAASGNTVQDNAILDNGLSGIRALSSSGNTVEGNTITDNAVTGVRLSSSSQNAIQGNAVTRNGHGFTIDQSQGNTIRRNNIWSNDKSGMQVFDVPAPVDGTDNWWGCPGGPEHGDCDAVIGSAVYDPWLTEANPQAAKE